MRIALCNEVIAHLDFPRQCALAASLGYDGLEVAPFTLGDESHLLGAGARSQIRRAASEAGVALTSLHWLLVNPAGLSITSGDPAVRAHTLDVMRRLIGLGADLGCAVMVHGSPAQRRLPDGAETAAARARGIDAFAGIAEDAARAGIIYCVEPLAPNETNFVNSIAEAAEIVNSIGNPALRTMIDCSAAGQSEGEPVAALIDRWLPTGLLAHIQVNDRNRRGPGQGGDRFAPVFAALRRNGYGGTVAIEPFEYVPDGPASAARAIGYVRGILEALP